MQTQIVTTFKLGKSTVVTLPKSLGIEPGTKMKTRKLRKKIIMEPEKEDLAKKLALVEKLSGGIKLSKAYKKKTGRDLTPEELNRIMESSYENLLSGRKRSSLL